MQNLESLLPNRVYVQSAVFEAGSGVKDPVSSLNDHILPFWSFASFNKAERQIFGKVTKDKVVLRCKRINGTGGIQPYFIGHFKESGGNIVLQGSFCLRKFDYLRYWFLVLFASTGLLFTATSLSLKEGSNSLIVSVCGLLLLILSPAFLVLFKVFTRSDVDDISYRIREALMRIK